MNSTQLCQLLSSTGEIRLMIYEAVLAGITDPREARQLTALLRTCKTILREATPTFKQHFKQQQKLAERALDRAAETMRFAISLVVHSLRPPCEQPKDMWRHSDRANDWIKLGFDIFKQEMRRA